MVLEVSDLHHWSGKPVLVTLSDGSAHRGRLRTDLLSERSLSVYLTGLQEDDGATLYIDQIVDISLLSLPV